MTFIPHVFPKLRIPKNVVRSISKKSRFRKVTWQTGQNTAKILTTATLAYLSITVKVINLQKFSVSYIKKS